MPDEAAQAEGAARPARELAILLLHAPGRRRVALGSRMAREEQGAPQAAEEPIDRELLEHYLAGAAEKLATLEEALASARAGDAGAGDAVRQALHKLAGSAGTYGFTELGAEARDLEKRLQAADEPDRK